MIDLQHRQAKIRIDKSSLKSNLKMSVQYQKNELYLRSTDFRSSEGYSDGYQLKISLNTPNNDGRPVFGFVSGMINGTLPAVTPALVNGADQNRGPLGEFLSCQVYAAGFMLILNNSYLAI